MECWKNKVWECNLLIGANCLFRVEHTINKLDGLGFPIIQLEGSWYHSLIILPASFYFKTQGYTYEQNLLF
jgi:hypothetical protein